ncbi:MAG: NACHT domain-containing protein [Chloroflexota bacterium]
MGNEGDGSEVKFVQGAVNTQGGDFIGRDKITVTADVATDVSGLPNPYLGLRSFTYEDRLAYAGREAYVRQAVEILTAPESPQGLLFITGASGCGKSSFAQAGLMPALEAHYQARQRQVCRAVFHPSLQPMARLKDACLQLGLAAIDQETLKDAGAFWLWMDEHIPTGVINLLVIDQFEECFTQSAIDGREQLFALLAGFSARMATRMHMVATLRSDYLNELFQVKPLWEIAKRGIELRAMTNDELKAAIQRPLQAVCQVDERYRLKWFEPALLERLAGETAQDATYLPLLQVTLLGLWNGGRLRLGSFRNLAEAIRQRAETVYAYEDYDVPFPGRPRPETDRATVLAILLDLVNVSPDDDPRRDVRRRRTKQEVEADSAQRSRLVNDLIAARLLSAGVETFDNDSIETLDIVHEMLINNWERLRQAVAERRQVLQQRALFEQSLAEWKAKGSGSEYLLAGVRLAEARQLAQAGDIALRPSEARQYLEASLAQAEATQQRQLEQARALARTQRQRTSLFAIGLAAVLVLMSFVVLLYRQSEQRLGDAQVANTQSAAHAATAQAAGLEALAQANVARAGELASHALAHVGDQPDLAYLLSVAGYQLDVNYLTKNSLLTVLSSFPHLRVFLNGDGQSANSVAFSPDGRYLVSGYDNGKVILWDMASQQITGRTLGEHSNWVSCVAFSPDGGMAASGSGDGTIFLWDTATYQPVSQPLAGHVGGVTGVAFSPDGQTLASGGSDKTIILWDVATLKPVDQFLTGHSGSVKNLTFSPDGNILASGSGSWIYLWDVAKQQPIGQPLAGYESVAFSPDGQTLAYGANDGTIILWNITRQEPFGHPLAGHTGVVTSLDFSSDGQYLASGGWDRSIILWAVNTQQRLGLPMMAHTDVISSVAFSPDDQTLVSASWDGKVIVWGGDALWPVGQTLIEEPNYFTSLAFSPDSRELAVGGGDQTIQIWDLTRQQLIGQPLSGHTGMVNSVAFDPDGHILASGSEDQMIMLWEVTTQKLIGHSLAGHTGAIYSVAFSPDGKILASGSEDQTIMLWEVTTQKPIGHPLTGHTGAVNSVAFSPNQDILVSASDDGNIILWNVAEQRAIGQPLQGHNYEVLSLAFSPDGKTLASGSVDNTIILWDVATWKPIGQPLLGYANAVTGLAYSRDDQYLASAHWVQAVVLWDAIVKQPIGLPMKGHSLSVSNVALSPDNRIMASAGEDGRVVLWNIDSSAWLQYACQIAGRNFNSAEWNVYFPGEEERKVCPQWP